MLYTLYPYNGGFVYPYPTGCQLITTEAKQKGSGNFSGWYSEEWLEDTLVHGIVEPDGGAFCVFTEPRLEPRLSITSVYQQSRYEVDSLEDLAKELGLENLKIMDVL